MFSAVSKVNVYTRDWEHKVHKIGWYWIDDVPLIIVFFTIESFIYNVLYISVTLSVITLIPMHNNNVSATHVLYRHHRVEFVTGMLWKIVCVTGSEATISTCVISALASLEQLASRLLNSLLFSPCHAI